ncbi:MAG TPA: tRNA pseudouridine(55) synthase TruB [Xanthomonadales bacterium]|nr:tRNA pseudouridine(55) synthase TruB [Xanthomonadales bacterium]
MSRSGRGNNIHGIVLLDKPAGRSSNHALGDVKRLFHANKAGHTGSLDPFATGMLPICFGEATKTAGFMLDSDKSYLATAKLGVATSTGDVEGEVIQEMEVPSVSSSEIQEVLSGLTGEIDQVPPMYSALKHEGQPLYKLAREGREVERKARRITIHELTLESWEPPLLTFRVVCSKGTYVRTLAEDLAKLLGSCAHLVSLRRLFVLPFNPEAMVTMDDLGTAREDNRLEDLLLPVDAGLQGWPKIEITPGQVARFVNGNPVIVDSKETELVRVYDQEGKMLGLAESRPDGQAHPKRLFLLD